MWVGVLGALVARGADGKEVAIGGPVPSRLLATLVASGEDGLAVEALIEELWVANARRPADPIASVHTYVARLRSALGADAIITSTGRYRLGDLDIDAHQFEQQVNDLRAATDSPALAERWGDTLALWRGDAFAEYSDSQLIAPIAARLSELRNEATQNWIDARLANGESRELIADIDREVDRNPFHEGLRIQQMTALAKGGRQVDALRAAQEFRADLTEIGLEPSRKVGDLEQKIAADRTIPPVAARRDTTKSPEQELRGYTIGDRLGEGAFAIVFKGTQASVGRDVAIKQIRSNLADQPDFIRQFEAEAHLVARLEHPHIVPLYDYWREPGSAYLVMRHLNGGSLADQLLQGPLEPKRAASIITQIAAGLDEAHRSQVIHRDVKPANVLLDQLGNAYLSDFGIAVEEAERVDPEAWMSNGSPAYAPPEQLNREAVGPRADVYALGVTAYEILTGRLPFPTETTMAGLLERQLNDPIPLVRQTRPDLPAAIDTVVQRATAKDPADRYATAGAFAADFGRSAGLDGDDELVEPQDRNPYKGLQAFTEADAADFSGRNRLTTKLLSAVTDHRITAVVGPSGSGKSSVVRAGLIPAVRSGRLPDSDRWFVTTMIPGADPYADLEAALLRVAVNPPADLAVRLRRDEKGLAAAIDQIVPDDRQILLAVDQFEELFTLSKLRDRDRFLDSLIYAVTVGHPRLRVVLTIRADFYDHPLRHDGFARLIEDSTIAVHPLAADELERAITEPARSVGATFESGLIAQITADVADQPGALPLLQYALTELYDRRTDNTLTLAAYEGLGGVTGALARRAEEIYQDSSDGEQAALRLSFGRLVTLGEGSEDTRRRVLRSELDSAGQAANAIDRFGAARLLAFDREPTTREPTVEVAHEALIREWPRLRGWLDEDRDGLRILRHLTETSAGWDARGRDDADLYRGGRLEAAAEWAEHNADRLTDVEREFVHASQARAAAEAEAEVKSRKRLQRLLVGVGAVAVVALIAGVLAFQQQGKAQDNQAAAETERIAADAASRIEENPQLALLLAAEAHRRNPGPVGLGALQETLANAGNFLGVVGAGSDYSAAGWINNTTIAAAGESGVATYDITTGTRLTEFDLPIRDLVVDYGGDGSSSPHPIAGFTNTHAVGFPIDRPCCLVFVDLTTGDTTQSDVEHTPIWMDVHAERGVAVTMDMAGIVRLFDVGSGTLRWEIDAHPEGTVAELGVEPTAALAINEAWTRTDFDLTLFPIRGGSVGFTPDGDRVLSRRGVERVWNTTDGERAGPDVLEPLDENGIAKSRTDLVAFGDDDVLVRAGEFDLYGPAGRVEIDTTGPFYGLPDALALEGLSDGRFLVQLSDRRLAWIDLATGELGEPAIKLGLPQPGRLAVSPDETSVAVPSADGIGMWSLTGDQLLAAAFPRNGAKIGTIREDGARFTTADVAHRNAPWLDSPQQHVEVATGEQLTVDAWESEYITGYFAGSPVMVTFGQDWRSRSYDPITNDVVGEFDLLGFGALEHSSTGLAAYGVAAPGVAIFERDGTPITVLESEAYVTSASFSPDGSLLVAAALGASVFTVWDTETWEVVHDASAIDEPVRVASYSADGRYLLTVDDAGAVTIRDPETLEPIRELLGSRGGAFLNVDMAFSDDGRYLLFGGADNIRLWDLEEGVQIGSVFPNDPDFNFGPNNGPQLLTAVGDDLLVWNLDMTTWFEIACQAAGRNLTRSEWEQFGPSGEDYRATCPQWPELG